MKRSLATLVLLFALPLLIVGCAGDPQPAEATPEELEQHRQEMENVSARERGG